MLNANMIEGIKGLTAVAWAVAALIVIDNTVTHRGYGVGLITGVATILLSALGQFATAMTIDDLVAWAKSDRERRKWMSGGQ